MNYTAEQHPISTLAGLATLCVCALTAQGLTALRKVSISPQGRLGCIDGLRGLLALGVFLHHYVFTRYFFQTGQWQLPNSITFYNLTGPVGVALFFMVTGFLFYHKIESSHGRIDWTKLYTRRVFRLMPLYFLAFAVVLMIVLSVGGPKLRVPLWLLVKRIIEWLVFLGCPDINAFEDTGRIIAAVTWTIKYEWVFYLCLPLLAVLVRLRGKYHCVLFILTGTVLAIAAFDFTVPYVFLSTRYAIYFLAGALSASAYTKARLKTLMQRRSVSLLATAALLCVFTFIGMGNWLVQAVFLTLFFLPVALGNSIFGLLRFPALVLLGEISYSLYLLHGIVLYVFFSISFPSFMRIATSLQVSLLMPLVGCILVVTCWMTYLTIEKPSMDFGRSFAERLARPRLKSLSQNKSIEP